MAKGILGKKVGMTQIFTEDGILIPVTVIEVTPNVVLQKKTLETDGYLAVQLGYGEQKNPTKPQRGHADKAKTTPKRFVREIAGEEMQCFEVGQEVKANIFAEGELVDVTGISKGKGFSGTIKRWNMSRGPMAHGSKYHRGIGGNSVDQAKLSKGRHMPGQHGGFTKTIQNLPVVKIDLEKNIVLIRGSVPGAPDSFVIISNSVKKGTPAINAAALA